MLHKKMLSRTLVLIACLSCVGLNAQIGKYVRGYYLTPGGDSISGFIRTDISLESSKGIHFKSEKNGKATLIGSDGFRLVQLDEQTRYRSLADQPRRRVAKGVTEGPLSLYRSFIRGLGEVYFFIEPDSVVMIDKDNFRNKVEEFATVCPEIKEEDFKRYRHREFVDLARKYNACLFPEDSIEILEEARKFTIHAGGMLTWNSGRLILEEGNYYYRGNFDNFSSIGGGLTGELDLSPHARILIGLTYFRQEVRADSVNVIPFEEPATHSEVTFKLDYLELPLTLQWGWPLGAFRPFAEMGIYFGIPLSRKVEETLMPADPGHEDFLPENNFTGLNSGFIGGLGLGYDMGNDLELQLLARYVRSRTKMESLSEGFGNIPLVSDLGTEKIEAGLRLIWRGIY